MMQPQSAPPTDEKKEVLVDCALLIGSAVIQWDLGTLEKRYTHQCVLVLTSKHGMSDPPKVGQYAWTKSCTSKNDMSLN